MMMPKISQESLANDVVAYFEREAFQHRMMDTATLYKFLLHVPSGLLNSYLEKVYENLPDDELPAYGEYSDEPSI
jgi:hypothetical protein